MNMNYNELQKKSFLKPNEIIQKSTPIFPNNDDWSIEVIITEEDIVFTKNNEVKHLEKYRVYVDGVIWCETLNSLHASVIQDMYKCSKII